MADETMTKKVTDLTESTEPTDEDLFLAGSAGTASLRKIKWSNIWTKITSSILNKLVANNLITTAAGFLLDARQGKVLDDKLTKLNTNITHAVMPDYAKQTQVSSPYVAVSDGWIQCSLRSIGSISAIRIDGATVFNIGQTMSPTNYVTNFVTVPIAKGQTATLEGTFESMHFIPCIGA